MDITYIMKRKLIITAWLVLLIFSPIVAQERAPAWETLANMPTPRLGHSAVIYQGKIWVIAGKSQVNNTLNTVDCFDLEKKVWESSPAKLIHSRSDAAAVVYQNKIFVIGGRDDRQILNSVEYYDSAAGQWKEFAPLAYRRWGASAVVYRDKLFVINGITDKSIIPSPVDSVEYWDEASNTWKKSKDWQLYQARGFAQSVVIDSFVYTLGGYWFDNRLKFLERFSWTSGTDTLKSLQYPRVYFSAVKIKQLIYIIGGIGFDQSELLHSSIDYFSPFWNEWYTLKIPISKPRASLAAVSDDTSIYILGGIDANLKVLNSAERLTGIPLEDLPTTIVTDDQPIAKPKSHELLMIYPNPFNSITTISFQLAHQETEIDLEIFNLRGERVRTFNLNSLSPGVHQVQWDGSDDNGRPVESGIYFARLHSDQIWSSVLKLSLIK